jgi:hypothetical protein
VEEIVNTRKMAAVRRAIPLHAAADSPVKLVGAFTVEEKLAVSKEEEEQTINDSTLLLVIRDDQISLHKKYSKLLDIMKSFEERLSALEKKETPGGK